MLDNFLKSDSTLVTHQFGYDVLTMDTPPPLSINALKETVDYYITGGSYVFSCFVDFQKAFEKVNYWILYLKLLDDGVDDKIVTILDFWHSNQVYYVR